jgi:hypothetical protein
MVNRNTLVQLEARSSCRDETVGNLCGNWRLCQRFILFGGVSYKTCSQLPVGKRDEIFSLQLLGFFIRFVKRETNKVARACACAALSIDKCL